MTTAEYLILITALLLFAAAMIYFRMSRRSRSKESEKDTLDSISFESAAISISDTGDLEAFDDHAEVDSQESVEIRFKKTATEAYDKSEYLDDLEDAAAGLARLMHSSESERTIIPDEVTEEHEDETSDAATVVESVLGEDVIEQIDRIDSELDALEELVASIEESLEAFSSLGVDDPVEGEEEEALAEAA